MTCKVKKKEENTMLNFDLPVEVVVDFLARLPIKSLLRLRCVCKSWCTIINDPKFIHKHFNTRRSTANIEGYIFYKPSYTISCCKHVFSLFDATFAELQRPQLPFNCVSGQSFRIVGSCNGLLCLTDSNPHHFGRTIYLWNPFLGKFKQLNHSSIAHHACSKVVLGFGFDHQNIEYKVVRVLYFQDSPLPVVELYTLNTNSWRGIAAVIPRFKWSNSSHAFVNGTYHWMATKKLGDGKKNKFIMSFDFCDEVFREIELPNHLLDRKDLDMSIGLFRESLSLIVYHEDFLISQFAYIWVMKEYGVMDTWAELFTITLHDEIGRSLGFGWNDELLIRSCYGELLLYSPDIRKNKNCGELLLYSPDIRKIENIGTQMDLDVVTYVESLVLIKEGNDVCGQAKQFAGVTYKGISIVLKEDEEENCEPTTSKMG